MRSVFPRVSGVGTTMKQLCHRLASSRAWRHLQGPWEWLRIQWNLTDIYSEGTKKIISLDTKSGEITLWDGGAWWADVYGVTQSRTQLK